MPYAPLRPALEAVDKYRDTNDKTKYLIHLHVAALDQVGSETRLFLFAKALELTRAMLPGHELEEKQAELPLRWCEGLHTSYRQLFKISNTRIEIRHPADKAGNLWPRLNPEERVEFVQDVDRVVRGVVEQQLGLSVIELRNLT